MSNVFEIIKQKWDSSCGGEITAQPPLNKYGFAPFGSKNNPRTVVVKFTFYNQQPSESISNFDKFISALHMIGNRFEFVRWAVEKDFSKFNGRFTPKFKQIDVYALF